MASGVAPAAGRGPRRRGARGPRLGPLRRRTVTFEHVTDRDGLLAYYASVSYVGALEPERRGEVLGRLAAILDAHGVRDVRRPFRAQIVATR